MNHNVGRYTASFLKISHTSVVITESCNWISDKSLKYHTHLLLLSSYKGIRTIDPVIFVLNRYKHFRQTALDHYISIFAISESSLDQILKALN